MFQRSLSLRDSPWPLLLGAVGEAMPFTASLSRLKLLGIGMLKVASQTNRDLGTQEAVGDSCAAVVSAHFSRHADDASQASALAGTDIWGQNIL